MEASTLHTKLRSTAITLGRCFKWQRLFITLLLLFDFHFIANSCVELKSNWNGTHSSRIPFWRSICGSNLFRRLKNGLNAFYVKSFIKSVMNPLKAPHFPWDVVFFSLSVFAVTINNNNCLTCCVHASSHRSSCATQPIRCDE